MGGGFFSFLKICKHVCLVLLKMSNPKQRELVHHLSKLQLGLAAQHDIITEQHGKGREKKNPKAQEVYSPARKENEGPPAISEVIRNKTDT